MKLYMKLGSFIVFSLASFCINKIFKLSTGYEETDVFESVLSLFKDSNNKDVVSTLKSDIIASSTNYFV